jgi:hypothetical protein
MLTLLLDKLTILKELLEELLELLLPPPDSTKKLLKDLLLLKDMDQMMLIL